MATHEFPSVQIPRGPLARVARRPRRVAFAAVVLLGLAAFALLYQAPHGHSRETSDSPATAAVPAPKSRAPSRFLSVRDLFPSATEPAVIHAREATWLRADDEVFGVVVNGHARAYPLTLLAFHHAVNDLIEGVPLLASYCVVCSSGACYDPVVDGTRLLFGVEGAWNGTATLYDKTTGSVWLQMTGECALGPNAGKRLARRDTGRVTSWQEWSSVHPQTDVMAPEERYLFAPDQNGYVSREGARPGHAFIPAMMRPTLRVPDPRLPPNELLYGVSVGGVARAYPLAAFATSAVREEEVGSVPLTLWYDAVSRSTAVFDRRLDGHPLVFHVDAAGAFCDEGTGSRWTLDGVCVEGSLEGRRLRPVPGMRAEWYGWSAIHPDTTIAPPRSR